MEADGVIHPAHPGGKHHPDSCFDRLKPIRNRVAESRGLKAEEIYLKVPTSRKGISNICSILRITTSTADEAKDDPKYAPT
jgi:hypothetical protein